MYKLELALRAIHYPARNYWVTGWKALLYRVDDCLGRLTGAPPKSTHLTIGFFSNPLHAAVVGQADVDPSRFFTPRQAQAQTVEARNLVRGNATSQQMANASKERQWSSVTLRALVFRPCVGGMKACETAFLKCRRTTSWRARVHRRAPAYII